MNDYNALQPLFEATWQARKNLVDALRANATVVNPDSFSITENGVPKTLGELFGDRKDLVVIHNMGKSCSYCTLWADGLNGLLPHIESRTAIVLMNRDSLESQQEFAQSRNWKFRTTRDEDGAFTTAMGYAIKKDDKYSLMPGYTTFHKQDDGTILRVASDYFGPGDVYMPVFPMFELLQDGQGGWEPQYTYQKPLTISLP